MNTKQSAQARISHTFDARVEDPESEPIKVVIYRREIVDIEVQKGASLFPITLLLLYARARAWAGAQREQPHCIESLTLISQLCSEKDHKLIIFFANQLRPQRIEVGKSVYSKRIGNDLEFGFNYLYVCSNLW